MKSTILILLSLLFIVGCSNDKDPATMSNEELKTYFTKDIKGYLVELNNQNWDSSMDYIYPELFKFATKDQMVGALEQMGEVGMKMTINFIGLGEVSEVMTVDDEQFCRIEYQATILMNISDEVLLYADQLETSFESAYGIGTVNYNEDEQVFTIDANRIIIAITEKGTSNWKYLEYNKEQDALLGKLIPEEVIAEFNL